MATAKITGKNLYLAFGATVVAQGGAANVRKEWYSSFEYSLKGDTTEVTAGAVEYKEYIPTLRDGTAKLEMVFDSAEAALAMMESFDVLSQDVLTWGEVNGTATGSPKGQVNAIVTDLTKPFKFNDKAMISISFQFTGEWISNPLTARW